MFFFTLLNSISFPSGQALRAAKDIENQDATSAQLVSNHFKVFIRQDLFFIFKQRRELAEKESLIEREVCYTVYCEIITDVCFSVLNETKPLKSMRLR